STAAPSPSAWSAPPRADAWPRGDEDEIRVPTPRGRGDTVAPHIRASEGQRGALVPRAFYKRAAPARLAGGVERVRLGGAGLPSGHGGQEVGQAIVAPGDAALHAPLQDSVACLPGGVEHGLRDRGLPAYLDEYERPHGFAGVPGLIEDLRGHDPLRDHDLAI